MPTDPLPPAGRVLQYLRTFLLSTPLRLKIMGLALGLTLFFGAVIIAMVQVALDDNIDSFLQQESRFVAGELSYQVRDYLLINDIYGLSRMLRNTVQNRPDLRYAVVINAKREVMAHTFEGGFPVRLLREISQGIPAANESRRLKTSEGAIWETETLIGEGNEGTVRVGVKGDALRRQVSRLTGALVQTTIVTAGIAVLLSTLLTWLITRPVTDLLRATRAVMREDYSQRLVQDRQDELGRLTVAFNAMVDSLEQAQRTRREKEQLQREFLQRVMAGQESERRRIARELHDQTGQALASFMVDLKMLEQAGDQQTVRDGVLRLRRAITEEMEALHNLALELRPSVLDDLGLIPAMEMLTRQFTERHHIPVDLTTVGFAAKRPDTCSETCVYRIVQEALSNVARHARATRVTVLLEWRGEKIRGVVEDDGQGFELSQLEGSGKLGVFGMRERAQLMQGSFRVESASEQGTMIVFEVPAMVEVCHEQG